MSSSDGAAESAATDGAAPARPGLGARLATLAERFRLPPATRLSLVILLTVFALVRASPGASSLITRRFVSSASSHAAPSAFLAASLSAAAAVAARPTAA